MSADRLHDLFSPASLFRVVCLLLLGVITYLGDRTLTAVQLLQFQQIKDGKDLDRHSEQLRDIEQRLRARGIAANSSLYGEVSE